MVIIPPEMEIEAETATTVEMATEMGTQVLTSPPTFHSMSRMLWISVALTTQLVSVRTRSTS